MARDPDDVEALRRELGQLLARRRTAAGLTQGKFAREMGIDRVTIAGIETNLHGAPRALWERFDALLNAHGELVQAFDRWLFAKAEWDRMSPVVGLVEGTFGLAARIGTHGPVSDAHKTALQWLVSIDSNMPTPQHNLHQASQEHQDTVARLQSARHQLKAIDNEHGGAAAFPLMADCIRRHVRPVLRDRVRDATGDPLLRAAAHLILDAGWAAYDADAQAYARRCMRTALHVADAVGDRLFGGRVLAALAHQSLHVGRKQEAVLLATAALQGTERIAGPQAVAMFEAMLACATASIGDRRSCEAALIRAERALDRAEGNPDVPSWLDFDHGGLAGHAARAYRDLGHSARAHQFATDAIELCQGSHLRTQVQRMAILATALVGAGDTEQACAVARDLLVQARPLRSGLVLSDIRALTRLLGTDSIANEIRDQARQLKRDSNIAIVGKPARARDEASGSR